MNKALAIFGRDARIAVSYPVSFWTQWASIFLSVLGLWFIAKLVPPSAQLGFRGAHGGYFDYVVLNVAFFSIQATALQAFHRAIRDDQMLGTLESMLATPTSLSLIILSSSLWAFALTVLQAFVYLGLASVVFGLNLGHTNVITALAFLALIVTSSAPLGVLSAAATMKFKQAAPTGLIAGGAASLLSGVLFPVALLPRWLQAVSWLLPITHGLSGMRAAVAGASLAQMQADALWLVVASAVLLPLSLLAFRRSVYRAKVDGTLGQY